MNHSTHSSGTPNHRVVRRSDNLRDGFNRVHVSDPAPLGPSSLKWARAHDFEKSGDGLSLESRVANEYRITGSDPNDVKYQISMKKFNAAETDFETQIRLKGPTDAVSNVQNTVDLVFANSKDLATFASAVVGSLTRSAMKSKEV